LKKPGNISLPVIPRPSTVTTGVHRKPSFRSVQPKPASSSQTTHPQPALAAVNGTLTPVPGAVASVHAPAAAATTPLPPKSEARLFPSTTQPDPLLKKRFIIPVWGWLVGAAVILLLSLMVILWSQGVFPFNPSSGSLLKPNPPLIEATQPSQAIGTVTASSQASIVLGQADKLAFVKSSDIWASNLDGSGLVQLTTDGESKSNLNWTPDGQSIIYTSGSCIDLVGLHTRRIN
jgi:hypothetical protein